LLIKPGVDAPIIGQSRKEQLDYLLQEVDLTISAEQNDKLEAPYQPHPVVGFK
ncbi:aldo/keto reductase, partial [Klebsiella pneumoniae]|nr:aldo/keto reductase [Klebsiella pneumoniae]